MVLPSIAARVDAVEMRADVNRSRARRAQIAATGVAAESRAVVAQAQQARRRSQALVDASKALRTRPH